MVSRCGRTCELVQAYRSKLCRVTSAACTINSYSNVTYFEVFSTRYHICWPPCYVTPDLSYYWERENRRVKIINGCDKKKKKKNSGKEGDMASFFGQDLGLAAVAITCPRRPQAFKRVNDDQASPQELKHLFFMLFSERVDCSHSKACL